VEGSEVKFEAGRDLRFYARGLTSATINVNDLGGPWQGVIGAGDVSVRLRAGGDVVTDQRVAALPPDYVLGQIEKQGAAAAP
jgi:hypothetical protein